ncbi:CTP synthase [Candidatus Uhrbacteria bacterium RIFCSPHIGHO2_02_FULL_60_10]|uniref:CTP synthase n=1 Tax=Candidatus Uhrbacteria bacterium RIFCSPHIGHO2_02_FULL_60_10 TaxID=1802392 RepID=A0A1F7U5S2_9BACT|nr:MAG: CTP synthase [Candidatus Uhrbacteria bacterium RIFCSPHIGHO2_02_FULL_60_10]
MPKYIFIAGGVISGVGKGVACASIGRILQSYGYRVTAIKIDPYINIDAGTMNPVEHGEVFVTHDADETDQDIGNYERFLDEEIGSVNYMTTGRVYQTVINRERNLEYGGRTVEVVPHVPEEVIRRIKAAQRHAQADVVMIEIGGTVGEYQNILFLEAARMLKLEQPRDVATILVSYLPVPSNTGEMKTKPTQYAVRTLNSAGIQPDFVLARGHEPLDEPRRRKLSIFCNLPEDRIISAPDVANIYEIPLNFEKEKLGRKLMRLLGLKARGEDLKDWRRLVSRINGAKREVRIGIVGKYFASGSFTLADSYISVIEAVKHAVWSAGGKPIIEWLNAEQYEKDPKSVRELAKYDGVIVPGGFGSRGIEGKIAAIRWCREHRKPFFGLCYGMQLAVVEFARHVAGMKRANTTEIDPETPQPVIHIMPEQERLVKQKKFGATMRLGAWPCHLADGTLCRRAYGRAEISERHRHRYEFNNAYRERLRQAGLVIAGTSPDGLLVEAVEIKKHPFFVGTQFHPEFLSRPLSPHPLFRAFAKAAMRKA